MTNRLILGTANFGLEYGIANKRKLNREEVFEILDLAKSQGVWGLDTARAYGDSEAVIGEFFSKQGKVFNTITKLPPKEFGSSKDVEEEIFGSIRNLQVEYLDFVLIHSYNAYKKYGHIILPVLKSLQKAKVIKQYGISVYHKEEISDFIKGSGDNVAIEFPVNLFDQRFIEEGFLEKLKADGHLLIARSVFLQGLFFLDLPQVRGRFSDVETKLMMIRNIADKYNMESVCIALFFAFSKPCIDGVVIGVDSKEQLMNNIRCLTEKNSGIYSQIEHVLFDLRVDDENIILPYKWNT